MSRQREERIPRENDDDESLHDIALAVKGFEREKKIPLLLLWGRVFFADRPTHPQELLQKPIAHKELRALICNNLNDIPRFAFLDSLFSQRVY
jgi:hypothetical protein